MSSRLFVGNFDLEHQLSARRPVQASARIAAELAATWLGIAEEGDFLWMPHRPEVGYFAYLASQGFPHLQAVSDEEELRQIRKQTPLGLAKKQLPYFPSPHPTLSPKGRGDIGQLFFRQSLACCPWGWSSEVRAFAERNNLAITAPPLEAVRIANSRRFSFALEMEMGIGLAKSRQVGSLSEWETALQSFSPEERWVAKAEFGMSARERQLGRGPVLSDSAAAWGAKRFEAGEVLIVEPWVEAAAEAGLQFKIPPPGEGKPVCLGIAPLLTDSSGVYRGSRFDRPAETEQDWSQAVKFGQIAAERLQALGYFGPLGIDAMWCRNLKGELKLRPIQDVNARWTMGRLSLGFRSRLRNDEVGAWLHLRCPAKTPTAAEDWWQSLARSLPGEIRLFRTSPLTTGDHVTHHATALVVDSDPESLSLGIQNLLSQG